MLAWSIKGKIIRTVRCCIVYQNCTQLWAHTIGFSLFYLPRASLFVLCFLVYFFLFVLCCQYQCKWLPGRLVSKMTRYVSSGT